MASISRGQVEMLIHVTAPSRGQDDARYRLLAQAYLDFEPTICQSPDKEPPSDYLEESNQQIHSHLHEELLQSMQDERESEASYRPDDEQPESTVQTESLEHNNLSRVSNPSQTLNSPELSFNSTIDNANSPLFRGPVTCMEENGIQQQNQSQNSAGSWEPPPSTVADSQPDNNRTIPALRSPTRVLEIYHQEFESLGERSPATNGRILQDDQARSPRASFRGEDVPPAFSGRVERQLSTSSGIPSSPPQAKTTNETYFEIVLRNRDHGPPATQDPELPLKRKCPEASSDEANVSSSAPATSFASSSISAPTQSPTDRKRQRTLLPSSRGEARSKVVSPGETSIVATPIAEDVPLIWGGKLEVWPSRPVTSSGDLAPEALVTKSLQRLARSISPPVGFRPKYQARDLRPMERGYWLVNCQDWDVELRTRCYNFLGNYVGRDLAGWGVWCVRDEELASLRVYCWGRVVKHIYLLLFIASEKKIKGAGASWIGGDGEAIIRMRLR